LLWTRRTTEKIAEALAQLDISVSPRTVARLLKQLGYSLKTNRKNASNGTPETRDQQFGIIEELRCQFAHEGLPAISIDTKKKELIGNFKNSGQTWCREPRLVNDHDFRSYSKGIAIPYGIYDPLANKGTVYLGTSYDTPYFAVDNLARWWRQEGMHRYSNAKRLLILADGGGSNSSTARAWKYGLQERLCDVFGLSLSVCHYPPGTSKWNPIEHRLFSEISKNWAGVPLDSYDTVLNYIRTTRTQNGLSVAAHLVDKAYEKGVKISDAQMKTLNITKHQPLPKWHYTMKPR